MGGPQTGVVGGDLAVKGPGPPSCWSRPEAISNRRLAGSSASDGRLIEFVRSQVVVGTPGVPMVVRNLFISGRWLRYVE